MHQVHGGLNALRGLLALVVLLGHSFDVFVKPTGSMPFLAEAAINATHSAVRCFFVLSGYVIAMSLDENRRRGFSITDYALSRAVRIVPPLLVTILLVWVTADALRLAGLATIQSGERAEFVTHPAEQLLALFTLAQWGDLTGGLNGPLWTLAEEIKLYTFAGLVASALFSRARTVAAVLLVALLYWMDSRNQLTDRNVVIAATFGLGALAYGARALEWKRIAGFTLLISCGAVALLAAANNQRLGEDPRYFALLGFDTAMAALCAVLIQVIARTGALAGWKSLGASSYTLYILHYPALLFAYCLGANLLAVPLVLAFCWAIGYVVERPRSQKRAVLV